MRQILQALTVAVAAVVAGENSGCAMHTARAARDYRTELTACLASSTDHASADDCRRRVDKKYNVCKNVTTDYYGPCPEELP